MTIAAQRKVAGLGLGEQRAMDRARLGNAARADRADAPRSQ